MENSCVIETSKSPNGSIIQTKNPSMDSFSQFSLRLEEFWVLDRHTSENVAIMRTAIKFLKLKKTLKTLILHNFPIILIPKPSKFNLFMTL